MSFNLLNVGQLIIVSYLFISCKINTGGAKIHQEQGKYLKTSSGLLSFFKKKNSNNRQLYETDNFLKSLQKLSNKVSLEIGNTSIKHLKKKLASLEKKLNKTIKITSKKVSNKEIKNIATIMNSIKEEISQSKHFYNNIEYQDLIKDIFDKYNIVAESYNKNIQKNENKLPIYEVKYEYKNYFEVTKLNKLN